ncbi:hypothetical protein BS17DRAFT_851723 [Gyrodon lividus]|nr:hypothetical protein BS17DRAFT_851723 [Gyrodon lividus]
MSTQQLTISCPNLSQSNLHLGLYYVGCWIEAAISYLVHQPDKYWPDNWQQLLDSEFQLLHALEQIHTTRPTSAIPTPAFQGVYHISHQNLQMALQAFDMRNSSMSTNVPTFLWNLDPILADSFQGKWWVNSMEHNGRQEEYDVRADTLTSRRKYFQASIILFRAE